MSKKDMYDNDRPIKATRFDYLVKRAELALAEEFYLEASWLCYAIIEERIRSVIVKLNGTVKSNWKIFDCITEIEKKRPSDTILNELFPKDFTDKINAWRSKRNSLMHDLVESESNQVEFKDAAQEGREIVREIKKAVRLLKARLKVDGRLASPTS